MGNRSSSMARRIAVVTVANAIRKKPFARDYGRPVTPRWFRQ